MRANADTFSAGTAILTADDRAAIDNMNRVKGACLCAGTLAQTAIGTGFGAAAGGKRNLITGNCALVVVDKPGLVAGTGAFDKCNLADKIFDRQSHDGRNLSRRIGTANRTGGRFGLPFYNGFCQCITAGISASATVVAGQALPNLGDFSIGRNMEYLSCKSQQQPDDQADQGDD